MATTHSPPSTPFSMNSMPLPRSCPRPPLYLALLHTSMVFVGCRRLGEGGVLQCFGWVDGCSFREGGKEEGRAGEGQAARHERSCICLSPVMSYPGCV